MAYILMLLGGLLIYLGIKRKINADKPIGEMSGIDIGKAGCSGYLKIMMIAGGAVLIVIGFIWLIFFRF